jgi:HSP20 family protein
MLWRNVNQSGNGNGSTWPRRSVWREMDRLQRQMDQMLQNLQRPVAPRFPAMNVWSGRDTAMITVEVPGVEPGDLDISIVGESITLSGERKDAELNDNQRYHRRERSSGRFDRTLQLPFRIDPGKVEATFHNGVLQIVLPRAEEDKPRKISVKSS